MQKKIISYRQEEKYFLNFKEISKILSKYNASYQFPMRIVNSIYFDSLDFKNFIDSEEGIVPRKKVRLRWYGNSSKVPRDSLVEIKTTMPNYRIKETQRFKFESFKSLQSFLKNNLKAHLIPVCQISYKRYYYYSKLNKDLSFTYDFDIKYRRSDKHQFFIMPQNIFEIKQKKDFSDQHFQNILGDSHTRFSKYNEAVTKLKV